jgi:hypothetical protein
MYTVLYSIYQCWKGRSSTGSGVPVHIFLDFLTMQRSWFAGFFCYYFDMLFARMDNFSPTFEIIAVDKNIVAIRH